MVRRAIVALLVVAVVLGGAAGWRKYQSDLRISEVKRRLNCPPGLGSRLPPPGTARAHGAPLVGLTGVGQFEKPVGLTTRMGDEALYVAEQSGRVVRFTEAGRTVVVDLTDEVSHGNEQGLLGLAFSPDGRYLYTNHTDPNGDTHITEWAFAGRSREGRRQVLQVDQPHLWHNGGHLSFGPDGLLYIGLGDGGSLSDLWKNGQDSGTLLGKILRIDPRPHGDRPYGLPADNPFVGEEGARGEIWAYGLRNPWRFSFDAETGDLWIADVGDGCFEELDFQPAGKGGSNYGWRNAEGAWVVDGPTAPDYVPPAYSYRRDGATTCAVVGGNVYRGSAIPDLRGWYVFGDFCHGDVMAWQGPGRGDPVPLGLTVGALSSFGVDAHGELYALSLSGAVHRLGPPTG